MKFRLDSGTSDPAAPLVLCLHGQGMNEDAFAAPLRRLFSLPAHFLIPRAIPGDPIETGTHLHCRYRAAVKPYPCEVPAARKIPSSQASSSRPYASAFRRGQRLPYAVDLNSLEDMYSRAAASGLAWEH